LIWLCLQVGVARAEGRVALVNLRFIDVPDEARRQWQDAIVRAVETRGLEVVTDEEMRELQAASHDLFDCVEARCTSEIGRRLHAELLLSGQISKLNEEWQARLALHAVDLGTTTENQVHHGSAETFGERLTETVSDLILADRRVARAVLVVRSRPPGAAIQIDGRRVGIAELEVTVPAGRHRLEATHENHDPFGMTFEVGPRERLEIELKLPPRTSHAPLLQTPPSPMWWTLRRIASVVMIVAGGALLISGIPLLALDGGCATDHCVFKYDTGAGGGALVGVGAALAVTGAVVLLTTRDAPVQTALAPGGLALRF
jgi:hypothetical protein